MLFQIITLLHAISMNCSVADKAVITEIFKFANRVITAVI